MCFCHEVTESPPCTGDHVTSPISSYAGTSQRGITAHNYVLGSQHSTSWTTAGRPRSGTTGSCSVSTCAQRVSTVHWGPLHIDLLAPTPGPVNVGSLRITLFLGPSFYQPSQDKHPRVSSHLKAAGSRRFLLPSKGCGSAARRPPWPASPTTATVLSAAALTVHVVRGRQVRAVRALDGGEGSRSSSDKLPQEKRHRLQPLPSFRCAARASPVRRRRRTQTVRAANRRSEPGHVPHSHCTRELSPHQWSLLG